MNKTNQDDQEQCGQLAESNQEVARSLNVNGAIYTRSASDRRPALSQNEPLRRAQMAEEQTKGDYAQAGNVKLGVAKEKSSQDSAFDGSYRSWSMNKPPTADTQTLTTPSTQLMPRMETSTPKSTLSPPRKSEYSLSKRHRVPEASPPRRSGVYSSQRTRLLVFIKIILKCLDYEDPSLHLEAKQIISECTRKNREGIPGYDPLAGAITNQLRMTVGEVHWNRAESL